ncbi:MAG: DUF4190 domain-containing protein, partial [Anaerohalosphaera sp.]|nr:DUF4190 domain-containing protein [Anaerohalosphaera sp.]
METVFSSRKFSKAAIVSFVLGVLCPFTVLLSFLPAVGLGWIGLSKIRHYGLRGAWLAWLGILLPIISLVGFLTLWAWDMEPIENDYTVADLRSVPADCEESYSYFLDLLEKDEEKIPENDKVIMYMGERLLIPSGTRDIPLGLGLDGDDYNKLHEISRNETIKTNTAELLQIVMENRSGIEHLWLKAEKGRKLVEKLNSYPEIADLMEPFSLASNDNVLWYSNLNTLRKIYRYYLLLQAELGNFEIAVDNLIVMDSVGWKLKANNRLHITSFSCIKIIDQCEDIAAIIATNPTCDLDSRQKLKDYYSQKRELSFENEIIFGYLIEKATLEDIIEKAGSFRNTFLIKKNSTLRLLHNYANDGLQAMGYREFDNEDFYSISRFQKETLLTFDDNRGSLERLYSIYNPAGLKLIYEILYSVSGGSRIRQKHNISRSLLVSILEDDLS